MVGVKILATIWLFMILIFTFGKTATQKSMSGVEYLINTLQIFTMAVAIYFVWV